MRVFYYFLKTAVDDMPVKDPIYSETFLGDIGEFIRIDGINYIIIDYVEEII